MAAIPPACAAFIGAPYCDDGKAPGAFNCWTLFRAARLAAFGLETADYDGPVWAGRDGVEAMASAAEAFAARFQLIATGDEWRAGKRLEQGGDAILLRHAGEPVHIGLVVAPGEMLHVNKGIDARIERYAHTQWRSRIIAFYRGT